MEEISKKTSLSAPSGSSTMEPDTRDKSPRRGSSPQGQRSVPHHHESNHYDIPNDRASVSKPKIKAQTPRKFKVKDDVEIIATHAHYEVSGHDWDDEAEIWIYTLRDRQSKIPYEDSVREDAIKKTRKSPR